MEIQLRDYRIQPHGHMVDWIAGWKGGVVLLRQPEGFQIVGAWVDRPHDRFVWLVGLLRRGRLRSGRGEVPRSAGTTIATPQPFRFRRGCNLGHGRRASVDHERGDVDAGLGNLSSELPCPLRARTCCPCLPASCRFRHRLRLSSDPRVPRPVGACRRTPGQCCRDPWRSGAGRLHP